jgi:hypothetical protein
MSFDEAKQAGLQRTTSVRARTERAPPRATAEHRSSITSWEAHYMRTCDCGWIADWDLGDKLSCTLYMLGSAIRMPCGRGPGSPRAGDPEVRGRGLVRRLLGPSPCSVGRYNYFRSQTRASRLRGIYTNSITICARARSGPSRHTGSPRRVGGDSSFRSTSTPASRVASATRETARP